MPHFIYLGGFSTLILVMVDLRRKGMVCTKSVNMKNFKNIRSNADMDADAEDGDEDIVR